VIRRRRLLLGGGVIVLALGALVVTGVRQSVVYFVTPSELLAAPDRGTARAYRLGGMVVQGSLARDPATRESRFLLTDGKASVPVYHRGIPPDLFGEGRGAVVEGTFGRDGTFLASTIMAKHSEEYRAPDGTPPGHQELLRTLQPGPAPGAPR
jgi:cytochrome c-type biogenesis protein CcmE